MPRPEDDQLDILEGLTAERDEPGAKVGRADSPAAEKSAGAGAVEKKAASKGSKGLMVLMVVLLLLVIGACAWLGQQVLSLQEKQLASDNALQLERSRVESISAQVHETGSSFVETGNVLESKFKFFDSEIRKLWDVAHKRNRKAIESNQAGVATAQKAADANQSQLKNIASKQSSLSADLEGLNRTLKAENTALRAMLDEQNEQLLLLKGQLEVVQARFQDWPNDLNERVASNEEAVKAIDASRQQLIRRLMQLQEQLDAVQKGSVAATP